MRLFRLFALLGLLCFLPSTTALAQDQLCGDRAEIQKILGDCREALAELKGMNAANPNYQTRKSTAFQIRRIRRQLKLLRAELAMQPEEQVQPQPTGPVAMDQASFNSLLKAVAAESFPKGRMRVVTDAAAGNFFTVAQLRRLLKKFSFEREKVNVAAKLHPRLVDPGNFFQVYQDLTFDTNKNALKKRISK